MRTKFVKISAILGVNFIQHNHHSSYQPHLIIVRVLGKTLDLSQGSIWDWEMKATLIGLFVALLMVGCVRDRRTDYYENGQKKYQRSFKDRHLIGPVTWWYESGQKKKELHFKYGGKQHGPATWWYENGQKMREKNYKDGKLDGLFITWNEKGKEIRRENYKNGEIVKD